MEFYEQIYRLAFINRYSNVPRVNSESVAEHSYFVAALVMKYYSKYDFNLGVALSIAIAHDMAETVVDDISHETKSLFPAVKEELKKAEKEVMKSFDIQFAWAFDRYEEGTSIEAKIVHLADAMQCHQYAKNEMQLGNNGYMVTVYTHSLERVNKLEKELESHVREDSPEYYR